MLAGNLLPPQILLIPVSKICEMLGIYDTLFALVVVQVGFGMGFFTFVLYGFMRSLPQEIFEAAKIDGAGDLRIYGTIVLPLCRPALAALAALESTWVFNDLLWALTVLRTDTKFPITAALLNLQGGYTTAWNVVAAGALIAAMPTTIVFFAFQKQFVSGPARGSQQVSWSPAHGHLDRTPSTSPADGAGPVLQDWTDGELARTGSQRPGRASRRPSTGCRRSSRRWAAGRSGQRTWWSTTADGLVGARLVWDAGRIVVDEGWSSVSGSPPPACDTTGHLAVELVIETSREHDVVSQVGHA